MKKKQLKKIDRVIKGLSDRYLPAAFAISEDLTQKLNLPSVIQEEAMSIYKKAYKKKISGRTTKIMIVACVYAAIRHSPDTSRTLLDIERVSNFKKNLFRHVIEKYTKSYNWNQDCQIQSKS